MRFKRQMPVVIPEDEFSPEGEPGVTYYRVGKMYMRRTIIGTGSSSPDGLIYPSGVAVFQHSRYPFAAQEKRRAAK